ncbi:MAG: glucose 1-dehydrogenase [Clostridia bacterium]|nr:glucose 1-dehydrogenase [Clostridia bacterium]
MKLAGKVAIVTGAQGGIGKAISLALAKEGADVVVADVRLGDRTIDENSPVVQEVKALGRKALPVEADVAKKADVQNMVEQTLNTFGQIDILVNCAGFTKPGMLHKLTEEDWDAVINVHLKGTFLAIQAVSENMRERKTGSIINVTSSAGIQGTIGQANYAAAKGGINALTMAAAREFATYGITVNAIAPFAETKMTETIATNEKFREKYLARVPMGRFGQPEEIAPSVVFLASEDARFITGQILCIDGGMIMR